MHTKDQEAYVFTKLLPKPQFEKIRKLIMGCQNKDTLEIRGSIARNTF